MVVAAVESGMPKTEVAEKFGICRSAVYSILERTKRDSPLISSYRALRADINAHNQITRQEKQVKILESITDEEIAAADLKTKMLALNALGLDKGREYEQERLETGQSTENVAVIVAAIKDVKRRMQDDSGRDGGELPGGE
jgi:predicted DNA-binding protein YlxM (UPF0122 family)